MLFVRVGGAASGAAWGRWQVWANVSPVSGGPAVETCFRLAFEGVAAEERGSVAYPVRNQGAVEKYLNKVSVVQAFDVENLQSRVVVHKTA